MKKLFISFILTMLISGALFAQISKGGTAWVSIKSATVKSSTWFFASTKGTLTMGDQVTVLQVNGNWAEIRSVANSALSGWTSINNLSARQIVASGANVSGDDIAMAGKGFNQEIENAYKTEDNLDYTGVDETEAIKVSQDELYKFVVDGHLVTGE